LKLNDLEHRKIKPHNPQTNGFVERFHRTAGEELFDVALERTQYRTLEALQIDLDKWLHHYNYERHHMGYRNQGLRPFDTVQQFLTKAPHTMKVEQGRQRVAVKREAKSTSKTLNYSHHSSS